MPGWVISVMFTPPPLVSALTVSGEADRMYSPSTGEYNPPFSKPQRPVLVVIQMWFEVITASELRP